MIRARDRDHRRTAGRSSNPLAARVCIRTPLNMRISRSANPFHRIHAPCRVLHGGRQALRWKHLHARVLFPSYTRENVSCIVAYDGFENFERAYARGKGVLFLTAHLGAWELSAFAHSLQGHPLSIVMRSLDNPYIDALIQRYRTMHGNRTVDKDDFVRGLLSAMRAGETVGILMDTNMTPPQGVFVDFFGIPACTASGLAR